MLVKRLLEHFDAYTVLHIDVNTVRDQLVEMGVADDITFHFVNMKAGSIRGIVYRYKRLNPPYGQCPECADIVIAEDMGEDGENEYWQRLVAVKELLHLADCNSLSAESQTAVDALFHNFALPPELRNPANSDLIRTHSYLNDNVRLYFALAILVPASCREILRSKYKVALSDREIAAIAKIPTRYVPIVMDAKFDEMLDLFLDYEKGHQPNG